MLHTQANSQACAHIHPTSSCVAVVQNTKSFGFNILVCFTFGVCTTTSVQGGYVPPLSLSCARQVLRGISLEVLPGRKVALVGTSGGGKTTIVNLVERFYDPHRGSVLFDGLPLTDIDHDYLHQQVSVMLLLKSSQTIDCAFSSVPSCVCLAALDANSTIPMLPFPIVAPVPLHKRAQAHVMAFNACLCDQTGCCSACVTHGTMQTVASGHLCIDCISATT